MLLNAAQIAPEAWSEDLGCAPVAERGVHGDARTFTDTRFCAAGAPPEPDRGFEATLVEPGGARVTIATPTGKPLLTEHEIGSGVIWLTTPRYLVSGVSLLELARRVFECFLRRHAPIEIRGRPLAHVVNDRPDASQLVTLANTSPEQWIGRIVIPAIVEAPSVPSARDVWNESSVVYEKIPAGLLVTLALPAWELAVLEVEWGKPR